MASEGEGSVTLWIQELKSGADLAAQKLWERYFAALVRLARTRLRAASRAVSDEEDIALSAFDSFCAAVAAGRFPQLDDRNNLWRILVAITHRKAADQVRRERRQKRGGGLVRNEADLDATDPGAGDGLWQVPGPEPSPEFAALVAEEYRRRLDGLRDETLRRVAQLRMEGYTAEEIAARLDLGLRTVARKLDLIRKAWAAEGPP